jgi:hypothetical protein
MLNPSLIAHRRELALIGLDGIEGSMKTDNLCIRGRQCAELPTSTLATYSQMSVAGNFFQIALVEAIHLYRAFVSLTIAALSCFQTERFQRHNAHY